MEVNALSGGRLKAAPIDLNRDRSFNRDDFVPLDPSDPDSELVAVTGLRSKVGITKSPGIVVDGAFEYLFTGGTDESDDDKCEGRLCREVGSVGLERGRQSWREIQ